MQNTSRIMMVWGLVLAFSGAVCLESLAQDSAGTARNRAQSEIRRVESDTVDRTKAAAPRRSRPDKTVEEALTTDGEAMPAADTKTTGDAKPEAKATKRAAEAKPDAETEPDKPAPRPRRASASGIMMMGLDVTGDGDLLDEAGVREGLEQAIVGQELSPEELTVLVADLNEDLVNRGYYLAQVNLEGRLPPRDGIVRLHVDKGRFGEIRLHQRGEDVTTPFNERYYKAEQILSRLSSIKPGDTFHYGVLYDGFYRLNAHPDLTTDVDLKLRRDAEAGQRIADLDVAVQDRIPLHGVFEIRNDGTDVTDEWQAALTLQYLNLTKNDDVLTLNIPVAVDLESIRSVSMGYNLPHDLWQGGSLSLFGGFSELDSENIIPNVGLEGDGWFVGVMAAQTLFLNDRHILEGSIGISHSALEDALLINDEAQQEREVMVTPLILGLNWSQYQADAWKGFNSAYLSLTLHSSSFPGASDDEDFEEQRENAKADYAVARLGFNRIQSIAAENDQPENDWTLFAKLEGQYATEPLIPSEQKGIGGASTVRGYIEREFLGDHGVNGTLEVRTPILRSNLLPGWFSGKTEEEPRRGTFEGLQFVTFVDAAYVALEDNLAGEDSSHNLVSAGLGFRLSLGSHFQVRADWGFPLVDTEDSDTSGRGHISAQVLF